MRAKLKLAGLAPLALALALPAVAFAAAAPGGRPAAQAPRSPREGALLNLTGTWVSIVNEDWRWRMVTPPKGDYPGIPLTPAGRAAADAWDPATDGSCKAYGAGAMMRNPTRLQISWVDDNTLKIEMDNGVQTRLIHFNQRPDANTPRTLQGFSVANWQPYNAVPAVVAGGAVVSNEQAVAGGSLHIRTTNTTGGWVRKNGVPYSQDAVIQEDIDVFPGPDGSQWLTVLAQVQDPVNFNGGFLTSTHFKKEPDNSKWHPRPCKAD
jgi:hypothetical protein